MKHGKRNTRLYKIWCCIKDRCCNRNYIAYPNYGAREITICDEWKDDFMVFHDWAVNNGYADNLTIDRIDNNKGYSPNNCRWATRRQQNRNRRITKLITYKGETKPLAEWCEILGLNYKTVFARLKYYNWSIEKALMLGG